MFDDQEVQEVEETEVEETEVEEEEDDEDGDLRRAAGKGVAEEKPAKKPRKPRSDAGVKRGPRKSPEAKEAKPAKRPAKTEAVAEDNAPKRRGRPKTKLDNFVEQDGSLLTISGADVYCRKLTPTKQAEWGIRSVVSGKMGVPCDPEPLVLKFKSPKTAAKFFSYSFGAETEDDEIIVAGSKTDWHSAALDDFLG